MQAYNLTIPADKLKLLIRLLEISHKAHKNNASPVDIKLELAAIPEQDIVEIKHKLSDLVS